MEHLPSNIERLLKSHSRYAYLLRCGLDDLERGENQRRYRVTSDGKGVVLAANIDATNIFYPVGTVTSADLCWALEFQGRGEMYFQPELRALVESIPNRRLGTISEVRFYLMNHVQGIDDKDCRLATPADLRLIQEFSDRYYPGSVFSARMLGLPFVLLFHEGKLAATAGVTYQNKQLCQIGNFLTSPNLRGKRLGARVGSHLLGILAKRQIREVRLEVYEKNRAACRLYETLGFSVEDFVLESLISEK